jgi:hypothetical protein
MNAYEAKHLYQYQLGLGQPTPTAPTTTTNNFINSSSSHINNSSSSHIMKQKLATRTNIQQPTAKTKHQHTTSNK